MSTTHRAFACLFAAAALIATSPQTHAQREPGRQEQRGIIKAVDANNITVAYGGGRETPATEKTYPLAKDVEVCVGGGFRLGGYFKEAKLGDLLPGLTVGLSLSADQKTVESIIAEEPMTRGVVKAVDAKKNTLTVTKFSGREEGSESVTYQLTADAEIAVDDGRGRRTSIREGKLEDLTEGAHVTLRLSLDKKQVAAVLAEGATLTGVVKSLDAAKRMMTVVVRPARGDEPAEERTLAIAKEAAVVIDDGKGRRLSVKEVKLADIPVGSAIMVRLAVDQSFVMQVKAEGPLLNGMLKGIDADKGTITIAIPRGRDDAEEKTLTIAKDARITLDGNPTKLADLTPGENGPFIQLRLTLNQQAVQSVSAFQPRARE